MRKQIFCFALSTIFGLTLCAAPQEQAPATPAPQEQAAPAPQSNGAQQFDPNRQVRMLTKKLNLTADQQQQLLPILTDRNQQVQAVLNDSSLSGKDRHGKMQAIREESQNKIKALLTQDQRQTYDGMLQQAREHHRGKNS